MRRILPLSLAGSLFCIAYAGIAGAEPRPATHIACVGDSTTYGSHASAPAKSYPSVLQGLVGKSVVVKNFGHSGATMLSTGYGDVPYNKQQEFTAATDFVSKAGAGAVVSVVIILGANDSKPVNWDPSGKPKNDQQYLKDYRAMVDHFAGLPTKPTVYIGLPLSTGTKPCCTIRGAVIKDQQIPLIKQVALEKHVPMVDLNTPTAGHPEYFDDGVHPNDGGYAIMAGLVLKGLQREPTVKITSPLTGATLSQSNLILTADAAGGTVDISSVEFLEGGKSIAKVTAKPFALPWLAAVGPHQVTARVTDKTLADATSTAVSFTVSAIGDGGAGGEGGGAGAESAEGGSTSSDGGTGGLSLPGSSGGESSPLAGTAGTLLPPAAGNSGDANAPSSPDETDAGCTCSISAQRHGDAAYSFLALSLIFAAQRRRSSREKSRNQLL